ncbi:acyltransferase [Vibrio cholerae]|nr:acyltransferase [Vibrio cholerae]
MQTNSKLKSLEALRGIAALLVAIDHSIIEYSNFISIVPSELLFIAKFLGSFSVGLFFLLSGFVIFLNISSSTSSQFLVKRAFRIYPVIIVSIIMGYIVKLAFGSMELNSESLKILFINMSLFGNLIIFNENNINPIIWTLAIEVKFYLIAALMLKIYNGRRLDTNIQYSIIIVSVVLSAVSIYILNIDMSPATVDIGVGVTILPFMFIGTVICYYYKSKLTYYHSLILVMLLILAMSVAPYPNYYSLELGFPSFFTAACVFMLAVFNDQFISFLNKKTLVFLGSVSYPLYSSHLVVIEVMRHKLSYGGVVGFTFRCVIVSIGLAYIIHKFIENPVHTRSKGWSKVFG